MSSKRGQKRKLQRLATLTNPGETALEELHQQHEKLPAPACKQGGRLCISAEARASVAKAHQRYEVHIPECTCEAGENAAAETLRGLEGLSVTDTFDGATVLITGATGYIGSLVRSIISIVCYSCPPPA